MELTIAHELNLLDDLLHSCFNAEPVPVLAATLFPEVPAIDNDAVYWALGCARQAELRARLGRGETLSSAADSCQYTATQADGMWRCL